MDLVNRLFGPRRHRRPVPTEAQVAAVDVDGMIATARDRGDGRSEPEIVASLLIGAELTAERHHDEDLRRRAAAAATATRDRLVTAVGEEEAARLLAASEGPVDEQGRPQRW